MMVFCEEWGVGEWFLVKSAKVKLLILKLFKGCCGYNRGFGDFYEEEVLRLTLVRLLLFEGSPKNRN